MKNIFALLLLISISASGQISTKKYKYIIVPVKYGFLNEANKYQLNVLTRVRLKEIGFEVFMNEGEKKPQELKQDRCLALNANVKRNKGLFSTSLIFELKDCFGKLVYESEGTSRIKSLKEAYKEALNKALKKFNNESTLYLKNTFNQGEEKANKAKIKTDITEFEVELPFEKRAKNYKLYGQTYWLLEDDNDYIIYTDKGETIYANLEYLGQGSYNFDSADIDGAAFFDPNGNLVVEYLAKNQDNIQKLEFKKQ